MNCMKQKKKKKRCLLAKEWCGCVSWKCTCRWQSSWSHEWHCPPCDPEPLHSSGPGCSGWPWRSSKLLLQATLIPAAQRTRPNRQRRWFPSTSRRAQMACSPLKGPRAHSPKGHQRWRSCCPQPRPRRRAARPSFRESGWWPRCHSQGTCGGYHQAPKRSHCHLQLKET